MKYFLGLHSSYVYYVFINCLHIIHTRVYYNYCVLDAIVTIFFLQIMFILLNNTCIHLRRNHLYAAWKSTSLLTLEYARIFVIYHLCNDDRYRLTGGHTNRGKRPLFFSTSTKQYKKCNCQSTAI